MPYQHPKVVKHSEGRYFYFPDFSLVLFLDLLFVLCTIQFTEKCKVCPLVDGVHIYQNPNRMYPCSTMFTYICFSLLLKYRCQTSMLQEPSEHLQGSLLDNHKLRLLKVWQICLAVAG